MRKTPRILTILMASALAATLLPQQPARSAEPWLEEDFQGGAGTFSASGVNATSQGHEGNGIRVDIPAGEHWGTTTHWNTASHLGSEPEEMWIRYWIKFPNGFRVDEPYRGKLPGFGGLYTYNCLGGRPSTSGAPCWSARLAFSPLYPGDGLPTSPVDPSKVTRISFYAYLLNSNDVGQNGSILHWDATKATLRHDRWYCVESRVKMNSLGQQNGILEGYVDGSRAFQAANLKFRRPGESHLKVKSLWFDVYYGGTGTSPKNNQIFFDSVAAGPDRVGCNDNPASSGTFYDDDGSVFEKDIEKLALSGITLGCNPPDNDRFCPEDSVTRGQMAAFLRRALGDSFQVQLPDPPGSPPDFWGTRADVEYKAALDLYASGGAPLDTYVVTYPIDDTSSSRDWMTSDGPSHWVPLQLESIWERGATPYVRVEVADLAGLVNGKYDNRVRRMLEAFASFTDQGGDRRVIIDVLPESNNDNHPYGDDPSRFKAAYRKVVEPARSELGNKVRTVFSALTRMNSNRHSHATWGIGGYRLFWPGDSLVDIAGISGYDDRAGSNVGLYEAAVSEMASVAGPGTPIIVSMGGAPNRPSEAAQIEYVGALADFAAVGEQMVGIQWEDRLRGDADMRVSSPSGLQSGFAAASIPARADGVDWLFSQAADDWRAARRSAIPFDDATSSVFVTDIRWLSATGITQGCGPRMFCPDDHVTRGQMAAFLSRALGLASPSQPVVFDDTAGHLFANDISKLAHAGITLGCNPPENDRFCPDSDVTRGQMAAFMVRAGLTD
jgi:hypothetical protein